MRSFFVKIKKIKGFTLLELLIALSVLALILMIAMLGYWHVEKSGETEACRASCELAEKAWNLSKAQVPDLDDEARMERLFGDMGELCPKGGVVIRVGHEFLCTVHDERSSEIDQTILAETCERNREYLYEEYQAYLQARGLVHSEISFEGFLDEVQRQICPSGGTLTSDGTGVQCSIHKKEEVPFL